MTNAPRVLFVSKPVAPPWHDGSKNLVRDVSANLQRAHPTVMSVAGAPAFSPRVRMEPVYRDSGGFAPSVLANARVMARLVAGDPHDLWHFVFAPNAASGVAARLARAAVRVRGWRGKVVQTVASAPRSFDRVARWMFGDAIVALSTWTHARLIAAGVDARRLRTIPPCAERPAASSPRDAQRARLRYGLGTGPVVLYPGDYEISRGAETVARAVATVTAALRDVRFVFACRAKTKATQEASDRIAALLRATGALEATRHVGEINDMGGLLAAADVVAFPVDRLYGKVDVPLVLLEALALHKPLVLVRGGPLEAITSACFCPPRDAPALAARLHRLLTNPAEARAQAAAGAELYRDTFRPGVVAAAYDALYEELLAGRRP